VILTGSEELTMQRTRWKTVVALAALVTALATLGGTAAPAEGRVDGPAAAKSTNATIRVGVIYSRTGLLSAYGAQYIQGLRLGLEYARANRLLGNNTIQLTTVDDGTDPAKAVAAFRDLAGQGFKIIAGSVSSGVALQLAPLAEQNRVLYISGPAATDAITGANRYTFRSGRQTLQDVLAVKEILGAGGGGRRIVVFAQDSAFGQGNVAAVRNVLGGKGHTVSSILVPLSANDFTPFAQQARSANPDLLFVAWAGTTAPAMWRALEQQGVMRDVTVATGLAERATWGSYAPGINFLSHYTYASPKNRVNTWLLNRMRRQNQVPDLFHPDGFNAALMLARAISRGGGTDVDRMIGSLEGWQFVGPKGVNRIRQQDHALLQPMFHVRLRQVGSRYTAVPVKSFSPGNLQPPVTPFR
jgi:branched-chain amino acid transport system substrate-binding protein